MSKSFSMTLAVFPLQLGLHNFNLKSCSLMLNPKAVDFLLRRKRKWKQGRTKEDQQGFTILGGCSWGEKHIKEGRRRSRFIGDRIESRLPFTLKSFLFSSISFLFFSSYFLNSFVWTLLILVLISILSIRKEVDFQFSDLESLCCNFYFLVKDLFQLHVLG